MRARRITHILITATATGSLLAACSGAGGSGGSGGGGQSINVLMVGNPQMEDIAKLTKDTFTKDTGIKVNFTILPENELRDKVTQDVATQAGQYDVATIGAYEVPIWEKNGWLHELSSYADKDTSFDKADLLKPMVTSLSGSDGKLYALPFYGESSFLMYNKDVMQAKGVTVPEHPTWQQIADIAAKVDGAEPGMRGICLRGLAGWGELGASLTTVVNTFGGTWFTKDWKAEVNSPAFKKATNFYVDLVRKHGEAGAAQAGFTECLNAMSQKKVAMWYDATSAAGSLEDPNASKIAGHVGYAYAPTVETKSSGWLWSWAWAMPKTTKKADAASKFMLWASGKDYEKLVGEKLGWSRVPAGKRASTYEIPEYQKAAAAFGDITLKSIEGADPANPGLQPRPTVGVQYVAVPEFQDLGTKVTQEISAAIAGKSGVDKALDDGQKLAEDVAKNYR
ncbi:sugar ABC transporter substrate-binding protein [Streptomyces sp. uw30]|uniref:ABC transporter substrate-binding protein n=1 Tax=Streptomyces sp. uw30 TaxID=1828179 RepID=UPI0011CE4279|nr:sugar ABC transporter substrate-binding protein [Streptomyces sp. uw30]TXS40130.1 sugar ABC transporter substrate-binding protein [Streptomyces sp. uw30]